MTSPTVRRAFGTRLTRLYPTRAHWLWSLVEGGSKYAPHQGKRECERRVRQMKESHV